MTPRQTTGFVVSLLRPVGLDRTAPAFSVLFRRRKAPAVTIPYHVGDAPILPDLLGQIP